MDDTKPLNDAEAVNCSTFDAEVVLRALGSVLVRKDIQRSGAPYHAYADVHNGFYRIEASSLYSGWKAISYCDKSCTQSHTDGFSDTTEAKAACEHHHATGKWE